MGAVYGLGGVVKRASIGPFKALRFQLSDECVVRFPDLPNNVYEGISISFKL